MRSGSRLLHISEQWLTDYLQGGHYMRPDLIRLLVDTDRKDLVTEKDKNGNGIAPIRTIDRVGLSKPLPAAKTPEGIASVENA
jgi:hypothetical protein